MYIGELLIERDGVRNTEEEGGPVLCERYNGDDDAAAARLDVWWPEPALDACGPPPPWAQWGGCSSGMWWWGGGRGAECAARPKEAIACVSSVDSAEWGSAWWWWWCAWVWPPLMSSLLLP